jgi:DNA-binding transcriptional LysR family regulator
MAHLPTVLRHLWAFQVTAEEQQFQLAAERLSIAQSAVSRRIKHLEEQLGLALFERQPGGARLTAPGAVFRDEVARILKLVEEAIARAQSVGEGRLGVLRIGFTEMAMRHSVLPDVITPFHAEHAGLELKLKPMTSPEVERAVRSEEIDLGFYHLNSEPLAEFEYRTVARHDLLIALPTSSPHARKRAVRLGDLHDEALIFPNRNTSPLMHDRLLTAFRLAGVYPRILMEGATSETMLHMVATGLGAGFVDSARRDSAPSGVALRPLLDFSETLDLQMAWRRDNRSPSLARFVAAILHALPARPARARPRRKAKDSSPRKGA